MKESRLKVLLVQLYSNGDCLYATAVARQIKQDHPGCHLTWAIAAFCKNIIAENPFVDATMVVAIKKDDVSAFRKFRKNILFQKSQGIFDEVYIIHNIDANHAYYDGCIRSSIFRAYPGPVTVPVTPILKLTPEELNKCEAFALRHQLTNYSNVLLFEFAPQSGQLNINLTISLQIAEAIIKQPRTAVILSSANKIEHVDMAIIDGSSLTLRETAGLTHYCTMLLGCSSGITWISTSSAAKRLPMVQLVNPNALWVNPISRDFKRFNLPVEEVIELIEFDSTKIINCVTLAMNDYKQARVRYNEVIPLHFKTTRTIVYNLLCYLQFGAILRHVKVNREVYGVNSSFYKELFLGFVTFPFKLMKNVVTKHLRSK